MAQATAVLPRHLHVVPSPSGRNCPAWCVEHADLFDAQVCEAAPIQTSDGSTIRLSHTLDQDNPTGQDYIAVYLANQDLMTRAQVREIAYALLRMADCGGETS